MKFSMKRLDKYDLLIQLIVWNKYKYSKINNYGRLQKNIYLTERYQCTPQMRLSVGVTTRGRRDHDRMIVGFTTTCAISAITTKVVSSNSAYARCTRYNIM
jgi:hypothetical protein